MTNPYQTPKAPLNSKPPLSNDFSIKEILLATFNFILTKPKQLLLSCLVPFCGFLMTGFLEVTVYGFFISILLSLLYVCFYCLLAINLHRLVLAENNSSLEHRYLRWEQSEWQFLGYILVLYLCYIPIGLVFLIPHIGIIIGVIIAFWLTGRLCLIFPSVALKDGLTLRESWNYTAPFQFQIFFISALLYGILVAPIYLAPSFFNHFIINAIIETFSGAILIISVSFIYHRIKTLYLAQQNTQADSEADQETSD